MNSKGIISKLFIYKMKRLTPQYFNPTSNDGEIIGSQIFSYKMKGFYSHFKAYVVEWRGGKIIYYFLKSQNFIKLSI